MRHTFRLLTLALAAAAALAAGACGSSGSGQDTDRLLADTFGTSKPVKSGRLDLLVDIRAAGLAGLPSPLRVTLDGPFQSTKPGATPKFDFDLGLATRDGRVKVGAISTGERGWVTIGSRAYTLSEGQFAGLAPQGGAGAGRGGVSLASLGADPRRWLVDVRDEGVTDLDGAKVVKLGAGVDVPRMLDDLDTVLGRLRGSTGSVGGAAVPGGIEPATRAQIARAVKDARVTIWTGEKDHALRRIAVDVNVSTAEQPKGRIRFDLAIAGLNREQAIGPPANPRPFSELTSALAVLGARAGGGGGTPATPAPAPGTATTPAPGGGTATTPAPGGGDYAECVAAAGADLAKVQACADLLSG